MGENGRERERERERQTDRQTDRQTERKRDRQIDRQTEKQFEKALMVTGSMLHGCYSRHQNKTKKKERKEAAAYCMTVCGSVSLLKSPDGS